MSEPSYNFLHTSMDVSMNMAIVLDYEKLKIAYMQVKREKDCLQQKYNELLESTVTFRPIRDESSLRSHCTEGIQNKIKQLEETVSKQTMEIKNLQNTVRSLELKNKLVDLITAVRDLNKEDKLEQNGKFTSKTLKKLRNNGNGENHCIFDTDSLEIKNYKKKLILDKINVTSDATTAFDQKYGTLRSEIIQYYSTQTFDYQSITQEDKDDADEWWLQ